MRILTILFTWFFRQQAESNKTPRFLSDPILGAIGESPILMTMLSWWLVPVVIMISSVLSSFDFSKSLLIHVLMCLIQPEVWWSVQILNNLAWMIYTTAYHSHKGRNPDHEVLILTEPHISASGLWCARCDLIHLTAWSMSFCTRHRAVSVQWSCFCVDLNISYKSFSLRRSTKWTQTIRSISLETKAYLETGR